MTVICGFFYGVASRLKLVKVKAIDMPSHVKVAFNKLFSFSVSF